MKLQVPRACGVIRGNRSCACCGICCFVVNKSHVLASLEERNNMFLDMHLMEGKTATTCGSIDLFH